MGERVRGFAFPAALAERPVATRFPADIGLATVTFYRAGRITLGAGPDDLRRYDEVVAARSGTRLGELLRVLPDPWGQRGTACGAVVVFASEVASVPPSRRSRYA